MVGPQPFSHLYSKKSGGFTSLELELSSPLEDELEELLLEELLLEELLEPHSRQKSAHGPPTILCLF